MPPMPDRSPRWRNTPPALFPPLLGLIGLGLGWRKAGLVLGFGPAAGDLVLGASAAVFLFCLVGYARKFIARPAVVAEDMRTLPGRAGLAAMSMSSMLCAAALAPMAPEAARLLLWVAMALHGAVLVMFLRSLALGPAEQRLVTPAWHLLFVGFIVAPLAATPLGLTGFSQIVFAATLPAAALIWGISLAQILRRDPPPPLRPLLAVHLAPVSLFGTVAAGLGWTTAAMVFAGGASALAASLLVKARYLTAAGFSALWGAFTFPAAAFASLMLALEPQGPVFGVIGLISLAAASALIPWIALRVLRLWLRGMLAQATNAARA